MDARTLSCHPLRQMSHAVVIQYLVTKLRHSGDTSDTTAQNITATLQAAIELRLSRVVATHRELNVIPALGSAKVVDPLVGVGLFTGDNALVHQPLQPQILHTKHTLHL